MSTTARPYLPPSLRRELLDLIRARDGSLHCRVCGHPAGVSLDHIDRDPSNQAPGNLRALCHSCNASRARYYEQAGLPPGDASSERFRSLEAAFVTLRCALRGRPVPADLAIPPAEPSIGCESARVCVPQGSADPQTVESLTFVPPAVSATEHLKVHLSIDDFGPVSAMFAAMASLPLLRS